MQGEEGVSTWMLRGGEVKGVREDYLLLSVHPQKMQDIYILGCTGSSQFTPQYQPLIVPLSLVQWGVGLCYPGAPKFGEPRGSIFPWPPRE